jgi:hypothetical protein
MLEEGSVARSTTSAREELPLPETGLNLTQPACD